VGEGDKEIKEKKEISRFWKLKWKNMMVGSGSFVIVTV
jgi:hypothetical protein